MSLVGRIRTALSVEVGNFYAERFPQNDAIDYPKGLIIEVSEEWEAEDDMAYRQYNRLTEIRWYDVQMNDFDTRKEQILDAILGLEDQDVKDVVYLGSGVDWIDTEGGLGLFVLTMEFEIEHILI